MTFLLTVTFTSSLARLTGEEQKIVKTTAFDLQMNPASPGMQFHRLDKAKDRNFWSVPVSSDIRLIIHRTDASLLLCYVNLTPCRVPASRQCDEHCALAHVSRPAPGRPASAEVAAPPE